MNAQVARGASQRIPIWRGGFVSPFAGEGARLRLEAQEAVKRRRLDRGDRIERPVTVEEAIALRHDQSKRRTERHQPLDIKLPKRLETLPDSLVTQADGTLVIKELPTRTRIFHALYCNLLLRHELVILLERDHYMSERDFVDFRTAVQNLPVGRAGEPSAEEVEALEKWYAETPLRRHAKNAAEEAQDRKRYQGYRQPQVSLLPDAFPPLPAMHFKAGEPLKPVVHAALRGVFTAVTRLPHFRHMAGLPYFRERHAQTHGRTVLVGIPQFRPDTIGAFLRVLRQHASRAPLEFKPLASVSKDKDRPAPHREAQKPKRILMVAGLFNGRIMDPAVLSELAALPALDVLQGQVVAQIAAAAGQNVVGALQQAATSSQQLVGLLSRAGGGEVVGKLEGFKQSLEKDKA